MSYNQVKKVKGEVFAKELRDAEGGILAIPEIAEIVRYAGDDAMALIPYLRAFALSLSDDSDDKREVEIRPVEEVLADAGYSFHLVKEMSDQEPFRKYYREGELLCSFNGSAWNWDVIFFAVREDADTVLHGGESRHRQDAYSTSVLRTKLSNNAVSIVSRYNHSVDNPDATFRNNLNSVADGLKAACESQFGLTLSKTGGIRDMLPEHYFVASDSRIIYAPTEQGGAHIGNEAWLEAGRIHTPKAHEIIIEGCILSADCQSLTPICDGSDIQGISKPWNDNAKLMVKAGYKLSRSGMTIYATRKGEKITIAELVTA